MMVFYEHLYLEAMTCRGNDGMLLVLHLHHLLTCSVFCRHMPSFIGRLCLHSRFRPCRIPDLTWSLCLLQISTSFASRFFLVFAKQGKQPISHSHCCARAGMNNGWKMSLAPRETGNKDQTTELWRPSPAHPHDASRSA